MYGYVSPLVEGYLEGLSVAWCSASRHGREVYVCGEGFGDVCDAGDGGACDDEVSYGGGQVDMLGEW